MNTGESLFMSEEANFGKKAFLKQTYSSLLTLFVGSVCCSNMKLRHLFFRAKEKRRKDGRVLPNRPP